MKKGALFKTIRVFVVLLVAVVIAVTLVIVRPKAKRQVPVEKGRLVEVFPGQGRGRSNGRGSFRHGGAP